MKNKKDLILIRGAGDIATGIAIRLYNCGFDIVMSETKKPSAIRREVSFCEAIYDGEKKVEGICATKAEKFDDIKKILSKKQIALFEDEKNNLYKRLKPDILVDAIIAKKNLGTHINMANIVIGVGPGFEAKKDVHAVVETKRGHNLARVYYEGSAEKNTGVPGIIGGVSKKRVIYSKNSGEFTHVAKIGDIVKKGETIAKVGDKKVKAKINGVLRGLLREDFIVKKDFKIADVDPRISEQKNCFSVSDKARSVGGGVLEAILKLKHTYKLA